MPWRLLCYHQIHPASAKRFERQLRSFKSRGWRFCGFSEGWSRLQRDETEKLVTVTFDDGDATVAAVAQRVLDAAGVKALLYLSTDYVEQGRVYKARGAPPAISWPGLEAWVKDGHEVGSHTHTHVNLAESRREVVAEELERSRGLIEARLGVTPVHFAYPWGQVPTHVDGLFGTDWQTAATINRGWNLQGVDRYRLKRDLIEPEWGSVKTRGRFFLGDQRWLYMTQRKIRRLIKL